MTITLELLRLNVCRQTFPLSKCKNQAAEGEGGGRPTNLLRKQEDLSLDALPSTLENARHGKHLTLVLGKGVGADRQIPGTSQPIIWSVSQPQVQQETLSKTK